MTMEQTVGFVLSLLVMTGGAIGSVLPALPGAPLILIAAIGHRIYFGPEGASTWVLVILFLFTLLSYVLDYLAGMYGARKLGASKRGMIGAVVGGVVGLFLGIPGLLLGPFVGATIFELAGGYELKQAARAGAGAFIGLAVGAVGKFALALSMICLFAANIIYRSGTV